MSKNKWESKKFLNKYLILCFLEKHTTFSICFNIQKNKYCTGKMLLTESLLVTS